MKKNNHYLEKRKEIMNSTKFKVEDFYGDVISKDSISTEQRTRLNIFFSQNNVNIDFRLKINLFKHKKKKNIDNQPSAPPCYE